jgi:hypothetical protein
MLRVLRKRLRERLRRFQAGNRLTQDLSILEDWS